MNLRGWRLATIRLMETMDSEEACFESHQYKDLATLCGVTPEVERAMDRRLEALIRQCPAYAEARACSTAP